MPMYAYGTPDDRFAAKYAVSETGCWEWTSTLNNKGYGRFYDGKRSVYAHRWSYERWVGPIPERMDIDHLCRNTRCVNPAHLEAVSHAENIRRGYEAKNQTHCKRGHELAVHALITSDGRRDCRACARLRAAALKGKLRSEPRVCPACEREFFPPWTSGPPRSYCSQACVNEMRRRRKACEEVDGWSLVLPSPNVEGSAA